MEKKRNIPPQLNKFMHPRNPYKSVSFKSLAVSYPEFRAHCTYDIKGKIYLDFKNTKSLKALTTALLHRDFGLEVNIPENRLVPTLPLRMNYLLWIEDLLSLVATPNESIIGFDIGTGATCVYPFVGCKKNGWHFIATEVDELSFKSAEENVLKNGFESSILLKKSSNLFDVLEDEDVTNFVKKVKGEELSLTSNPTNRRENLAKCQGDKLDSYLVDFTMCNPPFFSSEAEMDPNHNNKKETRSQPTSAPTGCAQERVTEGGEVAFIARIIDSSIQYKQIIRIFSTLIGKKNDVKSVVRLIKEKSGSCYVCVIETEFCQGRTMRWGVAWTFDKTVPLQKVLSKKTKLSQKPMLLNIPRSLMSSYTVQTVWPKIVTWLKEIKIKPRIVNRNNYFVSSIIKAYKATWLHQRQKKRKKLFQPQLQPQPQLQLQQRNEGTAVSCETTAEGSAEEENESKEPETKRLKVDIEAKSDISESTINTSLLPENGCFRDALTQSIDKHTKDESPDKNHSGLECLLRASLILRQNDALISVELKYLGGIGDKESVNQLLQYLRNKLTQ